MIIILSAINVIINQVRCKLYKILPTSTLYISIFLIIQWKKARMEKDIDNGTAEALIHAQRLKV